jgi:hypothetical protein
MFEMPHPANHIFLIYQLLAANTSMITILLYGSDSLCSTRKEPGNAGLLALFKA